MTDADPHARQPLFAGPVDLHLHSNRSDGTEDPADVVARARQEGLGTIALTDHDTTAGWAEAAAAATARGLTFIPGMELSARDGWRSVHVLAYLFDPADVDLLAETVRIRDDRIGRAERIVRSIGRDYPLRWAHVLAETEGDATVGRPHIADALVAQGIVRDRGEAFDGILHPRQGYYEAHYAPDPITAIELVVGAGGVPVIAHPAGRERMSDATLRRLIDAGLGGLEIDHRENTAEGRAWLHRIADAHDLIVTGSSDYHGAGKPNVPGENTTEPAMLQRIIDRASGSAPIYPAAR
ncbi:PHP domain-containing protein [Microbacterium sp. 22242]|uniref:PHP domain-containing protein n=1 Tax=Microbacterium sp. 22242 TaxID=3453896 RepID=UPI003F858432